MPSTVAIDAPSSATAREGAGRGDIDRLRSAVDDTYGDTVMLTVALADGEVAQGRKKCCSGGDKF